MGETVAASLKFNLSTPESNVTMSTLVGSLGAGRTVRSLWQKMQLGERLY